jgi:hypothetical protein
LSLPFALIVLVVALIVLLAARPSGSPLRRIGLGLAALLTLATAGLTLLLIVLLMDQNVHREANAYLLLGILFFGALAFVFGNLFSILRCSASSEPPTE